MCYLWNAERVGVRSLLALRLGMCLIARKVHLHINMMLTCSGTYHKCAAEVSFNPVLARGKQHMSCSLQTLAHRFLHTDMETHAHTYARTHMHTVSF